MVNHLRKHVFLVCVNANLFIDMYEQVGDFSYSWKFGKQEMAFRYYLNMGGIMNSVLTDYALMVMFLPLLCLIPCKNLSFQNEECK